MDASIKHWKIEEENNGDNFENTIINLKKFQIKKIKRDFNKKAIEIRLSELMDNKIKYKKNKLNDELYMVKRRKILNDAKPTPFQIYENLKKGILSILYNSTLKLNPEKINHKKFSSNNSISHLSTRYPLRFKKIVFKKKGMLSGSKYCFFPYLKKNNYKNNEKRKFGDFIIKNENKKHNSIYESYIKNLNNRNNFKNYCKKNKSLNLLLIGKNNKNNVNKKISNISNISL